MWFVNLFVNLTLAHTVSRAVPMISNEVSDPPMISSVRVFATPVLAPITKTRQGSRAARFPKRWAMVDHVSREDRRNGGYGLAG